ncbi:MAG: molecular chaperone DnaJ, partial [Bacteroidia bacterium]
METQAYFSNIRSQIQSELKSATVSIHVAVAWFTDAKLFAFLCVKAKAGLDVQLIMVDDPITQNSSINYNSLEQSGGKVYLINENNGALMHNKFCVIDGITTITGSYNWSIKAQSNHENITITRGYKELADLFIEEFKRIKIIYHGEDPLKRFDADIICKRLSIIDNLIQLEEYEQITNHATKINEHELTVEVSQIIQLLSQSDYENASVSIRSYLVKIKSVAKFTDADIERLKWEIKYLEIEIVSLENEKSTLEKIISDFVHNYNMEFGDVLIEILKLKKEKLKKAGNNKRSEEYEKA